MSGTKLVTTYPSLHPVEALSPDGNGVTNGATASSFAMDQIASYLNQILSKRLKVLATWNYRGTTAANPDTVVRMVFRVSPNTYSPVYLTPAYLRARLVVASSADDPGTEPDPRVDVSVFDVTSGDDVGLPVRTFHNTMRTLGGALAVSGEGYYDTDVALDSALAGPGLTKELRVTVSDYCRIISLVLYEVPHTALDPSKDVVLVGDTWFVGGRVLKNDIGDLYAILWHIFAEMGSVLFCWSPVLGSTNPAVVTAASFTNLWDSHTAYDAAAFGFWTWPELQGALHDDGIGIVLWVVVDPGSSGTDVVRGSFKLTSAAGDVCQLDVQNYTPIIGGGPASDKRVVICLQARWVGAGALTTAKLDLLAQYGGATEMDVYACGCYEKEPLDPRAIANLAVWLKADAIQGLSDGTGVTTWPDSSGHGFDFGQATSGKRPLYKTGVISGKPVVRFDGTDDFMSAADAAGYKAGALTVFVVANLDATGGTDGIAICYPHDVTHTSPFFRWALDLQVAGTASLVVASDVESASGVRPGLFRVYSYDTHNRQFERDTIETHINAASPPTITYPNAVGLYLGADVAGGENFKGDLAEVLVFARQLSQLERRQVEEYLAEKYGLQRGGIV